LGRDFELFQSLLDVLKSLREKAESAIKFPRVVGSSFELPKQLSSLLERTFHAALGVKQTFFPRCLSGTRGDGPDTCVIDRGCSSPRSFATLPGSLNLLILMLGRGC